MRNEDESFNQWERICTVSKVEVRTEYHKGSDDGVKVANFM